MELLRGTLGSLPAEKKHVVQVFISSTFSDTYGERNAFFREVIPNMRKFCRERNLEFQVADMRWGVRDEATNQHQTSNMVLKVVCESLQISHGPAFLAILGDRYGSRILPYAIPSTEFDVLFSTADSLGLNTAILSRWYWKDKNAIPDEYVQLPITSVLPHYGDENPENVELAQRDRHQWSLENAELTAVLRSASNAAYEAGKVVARTVDRYKWSVTEEEVMTALDQPNRANKSVFFLRSLDRINVYDSIAPKYIDLRKAAEVDEEAQELLHKLKEETVPEALPSENLISYSVPWSRNGIDSNYIRHQNYLFNFCRDSEAQLKRQIEAAANDTSVDCCDRLVMDVLHHLHVCRSVVESSVTREAMLANILTHLQTPSQTSSSSGTLASLGKISPSCYANGEQKMMTKMNNSLVGDDASELDLIVEVPCRKFTIPKLCMAESCKDKIDDWMSSVTNVGSGNHTTPLILHGLSGIGKTALLCTIFHRAVTWFPGCVRIIRFAGSTAMTNTMKDLLVGLINQISKVYKIQLPSDIDPVNFSFPYLRVIFLILLKRLDTSRQPLVILIDGIESLNSEQEAAVWWTETLPSNVYLIMTMCEDGMNANSAIQSVCSEQIHLSQPNDDEVAEIARKLLRLHNRRLTRRQFSSLTTTCSGMSPLFIRLMVDLASTWHSYDDDRNCQLTKVNVSDAIDNFFNILEVKHGSVLVHHAFGLLLVAVRGLSHMEMEDVLSLDDEVLQDTYLHQLPPDPTNIRLPPLLWRHIFNDVKDYMRQTSHGMFSVQSLHHSKLRLIACHRYMKSEEMKKGFHSALADYFLGYWYNRVKPLELYKQKKGSYPNCIRGVSPQPLRYMRSVINQRVLVELPEHLLYSGRHDEALSQCYLNIPFLSAFCTCFGVNRLLVDLQGCLNCLADPHVSAVKEMISALRILMVGVISNDGDQLVQQLHALLMSATKLNSSMRSLLEQSETYLRDSEIPQLLPVLPCLNLPHTILMEKIVLRTSNNKGLIVESPALDLAGGSIVMIEIGERPGTSFKVRKIHDDLKGEMRYDEMIPVHVSALKAVVPGTEMIVARVEDSNVSIAGDFLFHSKHFRPVSHTRWAAERSSIIATRDGDSSVVAMYQEEDTCVTLWDLSSDSVEPIASLPLDTSLPPPSQLLWSRSGRHLAAVTRLTPSVQLWYTDTAAAAVHSLSFAVQAASQGRGDGLVFTGSGVAFLDPTAGRVSYSALKDLSAPVNMLSASRSGDFLLSASAHETGCEPVRLWDLMEGHRVVSEIGEFAQEEDGRLHTAGFLNENRWLVFTCAEREPRVVLWLFGRGAGNYYEQALKLRYILGHAAPVTSLFISCQCDLVLTFGADGYALRWRRSVLEEEAMTNLFRARQARQKASGRLPSSGRPLSSAEQASEDEDEACVRRTTGLALSDEFKILTLIRSSGWLTFYDLPALEKESQRLTRFYPQPLSDLRSHDRWIAFRMSNAAVYVWDLKTLTEFHKISLPRREISCFDLATNFIVVCSGGAEAVGHLVDLKSGDLLEEIRCSNGMERILISPNERFVATHHFNVPMVIPRGMSQSPVPPVDQRPSDGEITALGMSQDGRLVVTGAKDGTIRVLDAFAGEIVAYLRQAAPVSVVHILTPQPGQPVRLVTGGYLRLFVWQVVSQQLERSIERHSGPLTLVTFLNDGEHLVTSGCDQELVLWSVDGWNCLTSVYLHHPVVHIATTASLSHIYVNGDPGMGSFTCLMPNESLSRFLSDDKKSNDAENGEGDSLLTFRSQAKAMAGAFTSPAGATDSQMCCVL